MKAVQDERVASHFTVGTVVRNTLFLALHNRTVIWLAVLFMGMVLMSAYLGWSATNTVNQIYAKVVPLLQQEGHAIPPNPTADLPALAMLRNMTTYISLLGALVVIVLGFQVISEDLRSGVFPLIVSRPVTRRQYALGKVFALVGFVVGLLFLAFATTVISVFLMPGVHVAPNDWLSLVQFYGVSALFLSAFGFLALASAARSPSESLGLLLPVGAWLVLTFVFPQLSANINPMAALNPVKAMVAPPTGTFFDMAGPVLAPFSLVSAYRDVAATILGFAPADPSSLGRVAGLFMMGIADLLMGILAMFALMRIPGTRSNSDE